MSTALAESHGVPVARMEAFIEELRLVKAGIAEMQGRLDYILNELAAEIRSELDIQGEEAPEADRPPPAEIVQPEGVADMPVEAPALRDTAAGPAEALPVAAETAIAIETICKPAPVSGDQLPLVRGIDEAAVAALADRGVTTFAGIAALSADDVAAIGQLLGDARRISKECWIEQAALLADGVATAHARSIENTAHTAVDASPEAVVPAGAAGDVVPRAEIDAAQAERASIAMLVPKVADVPVAETPAAEIVTAAELVLGSADKSADVPASDASTSLVPVPANVIVLAERRNRPVRTARSVAIRAGRWAAVITLIAMAVAIAAAGSGLASGQRELLPLKRGCAYLMDICSLLPGMPSWS
ncbi:MAG: hypothetical protein F9K29_01605 [Hyphomicrobiaceae bacterium]|nr:MAG: hypothetical protein F9K29_01605 [Hyphomicrobiaceae bacterium]